MTVLAAAAVWLMGALVVAGAACATASAFCGGRSRRQTYSGAPLPRFRATRRG